MPNLYQSLLPQSRTPFPPHARFTMQFFAVLALAVVANAAVVPQVPQVLDALRVLRGGKDLTVADQFNLIANAQAGKDYPINAVVPATAFSCGKYQQPGFYADTNAPSKCQAFHRCDENGIDSGFLCPNGTLFNQIVLACDWFFNIDCDASAQFADYSNSRLGVQDAVLLDTQDVYEATGAVVAAAPAAKPARRG